MTELDPQVGALLPEQVDVAVVGAGLGGLYAIYKLRSLGFTVHAIEAGDGVGGTWYWNRYPGCRCDVESLEYSYSFSDELQQQWHWPERYGTQPQILEYINHVADRFDLRSHITLNTRVSSARFERDQNLWILNTECGKTIAAPYCVMATGNLSTPRMPDIPGIDDFNGAFYHTGLWPKEGVNFSGQRVGVIGTGSSGVQMIPHIAEQAKHLYVFQRTANFSLPARNGPLDPEKERTHKSEYVERRRAAYDTPFGIAGYPPPSRSALDASTEERDELFAQKWAEGGSISYLYTFTDLLTNALSNETASEFVRQQIKSIVKDPETAEHLLPTDHPIGTKRLILDSNYYETYNQPNVDLVNIRNMPIERITARGIRTAEQEYELDAIAFATGFDAMTGAMKAIDIRTDSGAWIEQAWADGPHTYLGLMVADFPNLFMVTGPQSPGVKSQMIFSIEQHVNWIGECLTHMREKRLSTIEASRAAQDDWVEHNNQVADSTLYPLANSWYVGANIPGKPRVFMPYVGGVHNYTKKLNEVVEAGYAGFEFNMDGSDKRYLQASD